MSTSMSGFKPQATGQAQNKLPKGYQQGQLQQFTPEQMQLFQSLFSNLNPESYLSRLAGGDEQTFNQIEAPALKQFSGLQSNIANRFSGMGSGARRSSGFFNAQNTAAQDFASQLQSQRQQLQQQAIKDLMGMSESLLNQRPFDQFIYKKPKSPWGKIAGKALGPLAGLAVDLGTGDKEFEGTQQGVDTSLELVKALLGSAGKSGGIV